MNRRGGLGALKSPVSGCALFLSFEDLTEVSTGCGANLRGGGGEDILVVGGVRADVPGVSGVLANVHASLCRSGVLINKQVTKRRQYFV
jgi:hypothetical protein